jgi:hypothetical protein
MAGRLLDTGRNAFHESYRLFDDRRQLMGGLAHCAGKAITQNRKERGAIRMKKYMKILSIVLLVATFMAAISVTAFAAPTGDVAGAIEGTWNEASYQIKTVVNKVVFPAIDLVLAVFFFAKMGTAYFDYRKSGQFEWAAPAILFACLVFTMTAPLYIWQILGI